MRNTQRIDREIVLNAIGHGATTLTTIEGRSGLSRPRVARALHQLLEQAGKALVYDHAPSRAGRAAIVRDLVGLTN